MVKIKHKGMERNLVEWAEHLGMPYKVLTVRYSRHGANPDKLFAPYKDRGGCVPIYGHRVVGVAKKGMGEQAWSRLFYFKGKEQNLWRWAEELRINYKVLEMRVRRGKRGDALFAVPRGYCSKKLNSSE